MLKFYQRIDLLWFYYYDINNYEIDYWHKNIKKLNTNLKKVKNSGEKNNIIKFYLDC